MHYGTFYDIVNPGVAHFVYFKFTFSISYYREGRDQGKDRSPEESHHHDSEWGEVARSPHDHYPFCSPIARPHHQKAAAGLLGDCAQNHS